ncbi:hypothetical protein TNCV_3292641 [Trichonephila clavipes]|nr:hypothetical protein TNCV_3292641 [Trichonephila clavipes]
MNFNSVDAPTEDGNDDEKDLFCNELAHLWGLCSRHDRKTIMSDFNSKISREEMRNVQREKTVPMSTVKETWKISRERILQLSIQRETGYSNDLKTAKKVPQSQSTGG